MLTAPVQTGASARRGRCYTQLSKRRGLEPETRQAVQMSPRKIAHYRVTSKLGEGGLDKVYRATDTRLGRGLTRYRLEGRLPASPNHPNIAAVYGFSPDDTSDPANVRRPTASGWLFPERRPRGQRSSRFTSRPGGFFDEERQHVTAGGKRGG